MDIRSWYGAKRNEMDVVEMSMIGSVGGTDDWIVEYDKKRGMYRVSYFEDNHFRDECWFDAYEERELDKTFPRAIGGITFYSQQHLFEWVENMQKSTQKDEQEF